MTILQFYTCALVLLLLLLLDHDQRVNSDHDQRVNSDHDQRVNSDLLVSSSYIRRRRRSLSLSLNSALRREAIAHPDVHESNPNPNLNPVPAPFLWGVATAAYQVEGGIDSRGRTIWDAFARYCNSY